IETEEALVGGAAYDAHGDPLPRATLELVKASDAVLFGAVGGPKYDTLPRELRPEKAILQLRKECDFFANLRPANVFPELADASTLKAEVVSGLDIMIVRELTGDIYFGQPRGVSGAKGERVGINTMHYTEPQIRRILHVGFRTARQRGKRLCSIDKMKVLEATQLWRDIAVDIAPEYPDVQLSHMLVDNCAMQLVRNPRQFDVIVTGNMFGDILSDEASMLTGSIGMLPSASLDAKGKGLYEPIHGSAPDIAGKAIANPLAMILSAAMMFRYTFGRPDLAARIEKAVRAALAAGLRTADIASKNTKPCATSEMGAAVVKAL
ncbi:MAG: 3-isopropylmalate dehydrogenase, partial [Usitatibacter sp.]